jgi:hypothetical protein
MSTEDTSLPKPSGFLTLVWGLFFFSVFALLLLIWIQNNGPTSEVDDKRAAGRVILREALQKADDEKLTLVTWNDKAKGTVRIPIDDAKKLVVADLKARKVAPSAVKIDPVLPMPAPYDPNAAEPAPGALPSSPQGADTIRFELPAAKPAASLAPSFNAGLLAGVISIETSSLN